jgi:cytochrome P450
MAVAGSLVRWGTRHGIARAALTVAARGGEVQANIVMNPEVRRNPYPAYEDLRARGRLVTGRLGLLTADHEVCRTVLGSASAGVAMNPEALPRAFQRALRLTAEDLAIGALDPPSLLAVDPPDHTRYRRLVSKVFTPRAIESLRGHVERLADDLLDDLEATPSADLVRQYASLLPVTVIAEVLGVPTDRRLQFLEWGRAAAPSLDLGLGYRAFRRTEDAVRGLNAWMYGHFDRLRENPGDDILSRLVHLEVDGERLDGRELAATASLLLAAGFETTVNLIGNGAVLLMRHQEQLAAVRDDAGLWPNAVEEVLRFDSPVQNTARRILRPVTLAGRDVRPGTLVVTFLGGANRDPAVFERPDELDVRRHNARDHLAFSAGVHYCLGASLARLEGEVALRRLFDRFPDLELLGEPHRRPTRTLRGYDAIPVSLGTRRRATRAGQSVYS